MLTEHSFVVVEVIPKPIAQIIELIIVVGIDQLLGVGTSSVSLKTHCIQGVTLNKDSRKATIRMTHHRRVGLVGENFDDG
ncbi:hypothetical protein A7D16_16270 [Xanthomonas nasturtii]|uniref:Uncharacterized protein n=1 Tax=Xanthomonas nasturtii TaxID=1843581 RepID=A0A3E1KJW3_9XANT|nr:hypothetical protein A7D16_16270 [Xanthomonas nasturtii]RFF39031.1 hypothetical protein DZD52_10595 [Xanthomonas nasturtii]